MISRLRSVNRALVLVGGLVGVSMGCQKSTPCPAAPDCSVGQSDIDGLQEEVNSLKLKLAEALASPETIKVDPSILQIDGKPIEIAAKEGALKQEDVVKVMANGRDSLEACYSRALKRNSALHSGAVTLTVAFQVMPTGRARNIDLSPKSDRRMIDCMVQAIRRWTFPAFSGRPVGVESPMTLRPKK